MKAGTLGQTHRFKRCEASALVRNPSRIGAYTVEAGVATFLARYNVFGFAVPDTPFIPSALRSATSAKRSNASEGFKRSVVLMWFSMLFATRDGRRDSVETGLSAAGPGQFLSHSAGVEGSL